MDEALTLSAKPLADFARDLGLTQDDLRQLEEPAQLLGTISPADPSRLRAVTAESIAALIAAYGTSVRVQLRVGDLVLLDIASDMLEGDLHAFLGNPRARPDAVEISLDKGSLLKRVVPESDTAQVVLYLCPQAAEKALSTTLASFEDGLWPDADRRLTIVVSDGDGVLRGPCLTVVGSGDPGLAARISEPSGLTPAARATICAGRDDHISWDFAPTKALTPWHLRIDGQAGALETSRLHDLLDGHFLRLALLFTADRARRRGGTPNSTIQAEFRGSSQLAAVVVPETGVVTGGSPEGLQGVGQMLDWCYEGRTTGSSPDHLSDRLPLLQARVAQALEPAAEADRAARFVTQMPALLEGVKAHWKGFIEGKVSDYLDRVKELEEVVGEATIAFRDQTGQLVKGLIDSILAAVAVLVGSFLAAAFKDPFNAAIFRIALGAYVGYVALFPGGLGVGSNMRRFLSIRDNFKVRKRRFEQLLSADEVRDIVGNRITKATKSYWVWFGLVIAGYVVVIVAGVVALIVVPGHVTTAPAPAEK